MSRALCPRAVIKGLLAVSIIAAVAAAAGIQSAFAQSGSASAGNAAAGQSPSAGGKPTVMEFSAVWCAPCKRFAPIFDKARSGYESKANFESYDIDKGKGQTLRGKYKIQAVPTVIILDKNGKPVYQHVGLLSEADFTAAVDKAIKQ